MSKFLRIALSGLLAVLHVTVSAQGSRYTLAVRNNSPFDIYEMYFSTSESRVWGADVLRDKILSADGEIFRLSDLQTGEYDLKFVDEDGDTCVVRKVKIVENTTWTVTRDWLERCEFHQSAHPAPGPGRYTLTVRNSSRYDIHELYSTDALDQRWGPDLLGRQGLRSGGTFALPRRPAGQYDLKFVDEDGDECVVQQVRLNTDTSWTLTDDWLLRCEFGSNATGSPRSVRAARSGQR